MNEKNYVICPYCGEIIYTEKDSFYFYCCYCGKIIRLNENGNPERFNEI